jgi:hypothetical protein
VGLWKESDHLGDPGVNWRIILRWIFRKWDVGLWNERYDLGGAGVDWRIILRWILRNWDVEFWTGSSWLRIGTGGRHLCNAVVNLWVP